jgi:hypothetical protein
MKNMSIFLNTATLTKGFQNIKYINASNAHSNYAKMIRFSFLPLIMKK